MVVPISEGAYGYCGEVRAALRAAQLHCDVDITDRKMQKKVGGGCGRWLWWWRWW
jgi:threonyl-tRNA synthetase